MAAQYSNRQFFRKTAYSDEVDLGFLIHGLRLFMNIAPMMKALIPSDSVFTELQQHLTHSWFELFTDSHWIISALTPSDYLALSSTLMVLELGLIAIRAWIEWRRLSDCIKAINDAMKKPDLHPDHLDELLRAKTQAEAMLRHTYKKLAINFGVTLLSACLFAFKNILVPFIAVSVANPLVPFILAVLAFSISIANHYLNQYVDQQKPKIPKTEQSTRYSFFYEKPKRDTFSECRRMKTSINCQENFSRGGTVPLGANHHVTGMTLVQLTD